MSQVLVVQVNGNVQIEYNRDVPLTEKQHAYLDKLDRKMDAGFRLGDEQIDNPDQTQRAQFVAMQLIEALMDADDARIAASCSYLADRLPELKQIKAVITEGEAIAMELDFSEEYKKQVKVEFSMPSPGQLH